MSVNASYTKRFINLRGTLSCRLIGYETFVLVIFLSFARFALVASAQDSVRPNIIYIMADDLGYAELGCYGQKKIKTPNLDKMANAGMRFTQHYAGTAVCAPTRCSLMTGLHTGHTFIRANSPGYPNGQLPIPSDTETIATILRRVGYKTACIGKWGLGNFNNSGAATKQGFDHFFGYYDQRHAHNYYTDHLYRNSQRVALDGRTYSHDLLTAEAMTFLQQNADGPFFLYLPYCIPHTKFQVPELGGYENNDWKPNHKTHAAMITRMDRDVGRIIGKVKELGIAENTLIMFTSDHGAHGQSGTSKFFHSCGDFRGIKRSLYEGGLRTPFLAQWPGKIKAGTITHHISAFWDMLPTLAEICNAETTTNHDGISFAPTLFGKATQKEHEYLYWELFESKKHNRAVRYGKWKAVIPNWYKSQSPELYDLSSDVAESNDVAKKHPDVVRKVNHLLKTARTPSLYWNVKSKGFDVQKACIDTGIAPPKKRSKNQN